MEGRRARSLAAFVAFAALVAFASVADAQGTTPRRRGRAPRCPPGSAWLDAAHACVGTPTCPQGFRLDSGGFTCVPEMLHCPEGSQLEGGQCNRPAVCPEGTTADGDRCVRPATCGADGRLVDGR